MTGSGIGGDGNLIRGNFGSRVTGLDTDNPLIEAADTQSAASNVLNLRPKLGKLSEGNDPFKELATRLTDFFSKPESENHKAQKVKSACWNDLTDDKKPVFEPTFENLTGAKFSKNPEGELTITLSPDHVNQGYLQVLSDLTLVAEVIKRSFSRGETEHSIGFTFNPIENIKIISHPERNLVIPVDKITRDLDYQIGPEFKFIESKTYGLIPVASGMFNSQDVETGKLRTPDSNNSHLEKFAFNGKDSLNNPSSHLYDFNRSYFTPQNKMFIIPPVNKSMNGFRAVMEAYSYQKIQNELENTLHNHNDGRIFDNIEINPPNFLGTIKTSDEAPSYKKAIRSMANYQTSGDGIFKTPYLEDLKLNPATSALLEIDSLTLQGRNGTSALNDNMNYITTQYAKKNFNSKAMDNIYE
jgi:hypothetical protein